MIVDITKNVNGVDFGQFGKKSVHVQIKLKLEKNEWRLFCYYTYLLASDGKLTPIDKSLLGLEFITKVTNDCLADVKAMTDWKHE